MVLAAAWHRPTSKDPAAGKLHAVASATALSGAEARSSAVVDVAQPSDDSVELGSLACDERWTDAVRDVGEGIGAAEVDGGVGWAGSNALLVR